jgi:hypothetical protein
MRAMMKIIGSNAVWEMLCKPLNKMEKGVK